MMSRLHRLLFRLFQARKTVLFSLLGLFLVLLLSQVAEQPFEGLAGRSIGPQEIKSLPAFPGAEGFGAATIGGRGGRVIEVTNLNDNGSGSLRAAIEAQGPRVVVFRVGGTILLNTGLAIKHPYITIAGQTAPGGGITLRNNSNKKAPLHINTHDAVVRYLRSRPGSNLNETGDLDALTIAGAKGQVYNVIVDHCSLSWATDEVASTFYDAHDITIQWSILSEGLDCATHIEQGQRQCHSMGLLLGSNGSKNISIHHNLLAHNRRRNPLVKNSGVTDVVNNVVYNSGFGTKSFSPTEVLGTYGRAQANYVNNYFQPGVDTRSADWFIDTKEQPVAVYAEGNQVPKMVVQPDSQKWMVRRHHPAPTITTTSAQSAYEQVLMQAGDNCGLSPTGAFVTTRDTIDDRIVTEVKQKTGHIINDPSEVGGWIKVAAGTPPLDSDRDGMPDAFEARSGLNPKDPADASTDHDGNGYTNVEEFLNETCASKSL